MYYKINTSNICLLNKEKVNYSSIDNHLRFSCSDICSDKLLLNNQIMLKYKCTTYSKCNKSQFKSKYFYFIKKFNFKTSKIINLYTSQRFIYKMMFQLSSVGIKLLNYERGLLELNYSGIHIRTYGYFQDFHKNPSQKSHNFDFNSMIRKIENYIINRETIFIFRLCKTKI